MSRAAARPARAARGFTLVEALVAVSLTALVLLALGSALFAFGKAAVRVDQGLARIEALRLVPALLRASLGGVADSAHFESVAARQEGFYGTRGEVRWIGILAGRHGVGGLHHLRLYAERHGPGHALMLQYRPFQGAGGAPDWGEARPHPLVTGLDAFALAYRAPSPGAWDRSPQWLDEWPFPDRLPEAVRVSVTADGAPWPPLIVPLFPLPTDPGGAETLEDGLPS